jgi:hypothetical protein
VTGRGKSVGSRTTQFRAPELPNYGTQLPEGQADWPDASRAAAMLGITRRHLDNLYRQGRLMRYAHSDGSPRYNPSELAILQNSKGEEWVVDNPTAALLKQAYDYNAALQGRCDELVSGLLTLYRQSVEDLRSRCSKLEQTHGELVQAREAALNEAVERQAFAEQLRSQEARRDNVAKRLLDMAPDALRARLDRRSVHFLHSISTEQLQTAVLLGKDLWTAEQLRVLQDMLDARQRDEEKEANNQEKPS